MANKKEVRTTEESLRWLFRSLDERQQPESVAKEIRGLVDLTPVERKVVNKAALAQRRTYWSSMSTDFARPVDMQRQLDVAAELFGRPVAFSASDLAEIEAWVRSAQLTIGKTFGKSDFKFDRLPKSERAQLGIELSRRQYNKRFRVAARLERKMQRLAREQFKRSLTLASKNRLASQIAWNDFRADPNSAAFIAYYVARCNLRSLFTNTSQARPFDEICDVLLKRCQAQPDETNWWAIAHVYPVTEVLKHLSGLQKGILLGCYFNRLRGAAELLRELWETGKFRDDMVVQRGNDSSTWNVTAGAWNKLREGWFSLLDSLGMTDSIDAVCPGKVLRLMAGDVAFWHQATGGDVHPDTHIWKELPRPWEVLQGDRPCPRSLVEATCRQHGVDPVKSGWTAPRPGRYVEKFTPTPDLVHGVVVSSPELALLLRKCGVYSGKFIKTPEEVAAIAETIDEVRTAHRQQQEARAEQNRLDEP
ncbi:hypothetical protein [Blastopirellula marina]|uniref:hypothetical protein n=1 Tax=Blastopirellula marina TaxID=124 RepID=UPI0018EBB15B|nr:hypothetical protein [Blastopirellula marina]